MLRKRSPGGWSAHTKKNSPSIDRLLVLKTGGSLVRFSFPESGVDVVKSFTDTVVVVVVGLEGAVDVQVVCPSVELRLVDDYTVVTFSVPRGVENL